MSTLSCRSCATWAARADRFAVLSSQDQDYAVKAISERDKALRTIAERDDTIAFVTALAYAWAPFKDDGGTHWAGCHLVHADCFVYAIRAAMEGTP